MITEKRPSFPASKWCFHVDALAGKISSSSLPGTSPGTSIYTATRASLQPLVDVVKNLQIEFTNGLLLSQQDARGRTMDVLDAESRDVPVYVTKLRVTSVLLYLWIKVDSRQSIEPLVWWASGGTHIPEITGSILVAVIIFPTSSQSTSQGTTCHIRRSIAVTSPVQKETRPMPGGVSPFEH
jgi:hypothetical protein